MPKKKTKKTSYEKVHFEVDPYNRLVIAGTDKKTGVQRFRHVITGYFKTDKNNSLTYYVKTPTPEGAQIPHQIKLQGNWSLTDEHNLQLTLNNSVKHRLNYPIIGLFNKQFSATIFLISIKRFFR